MNKLKVKPANMLEMANRQKIIAFEEALAALPGSTFGDSDRAPLEHFFANGIYCRKIFIPAGTMGTGKIHRHEHPNFLLSGRVTVFTEDHGSEVIEGPKFMMSKAGTKRALYAHTDTVWFTIHRTDSTDLKVIEDEVIAKTYEELDNTERKELPCPGFWL